MRNGRQLGGEDRAAATEAVQLHALEALDQDAQFALGEAHHAVDAGEGADPEEVVDPGVLEVGVDLGGEGDRHALARGVLDRPDGGLVVQEDGRDHARVEHEALERQHDGGADGVGHGLAAAGSAMRRAAMRVVT